MNPYFNFKMQIQDAGIKDLFNIGSHIKRTGLLTDGQKLELASLMNWRKFSIHCPRIYTSQRFLLLQIT